MSPARIALIHALEEAIGPAHRAFRSLWPEAFVFDVVDTALSADLAHADTLEGAIAQRIDTLAAYAAAASGAGGTTTVILFTCSAFGQAIEAARSRQTIPVLKPNEAAFEAALQQGRRIGVIATFAPSILQLEVELRVMAAARGASIDVEMRLADGALQALKAGDADRHDQAIASAAGRLKSPDVVVLGQFSMARAAPRVEEMRLCNSVLTTPESAVRALRQTLQR
jgi:Asp/Glu/hydantoin racemase